MVDPSRRRRTDRTRAALLIWGGWLVVTGATFSFGKGIIHPYYSVALAPAVGALVGIGSVLAWQRRDSLATRMALGVTIGVTALWGGTLLGRSSWNAWLASVVLATGVLVAVLVVAAPTLRGRAGAAIAAAALVVALAGPTAYSLQTAATADGNALPSAGPDQGGRSGPGGGRRPGGFGPRAGAARGPLGAGFGGPPGANRRFPGGVPSLGGGAGGGAPGGGANSGGLLSGSTSSAKITALLDEDASSYRWAAAALGSNPASGFQLASGRSVMPIGGFNGSDPSPTLTQFKQYVADGDIHWFIAGGGGFGPRMRGGTGRGPGGVGGSASTGREISAWVATNFTSKTVDGVTLYDLTQR